VQAVCSVSEQHDLRQFTLHARDRLRALCLPACLSVCLSVTLVIHT